MGWLVAITKRKVMMAKRPLWALLVHDFGLMHSWLYPVVIVVGTNLLVISIYPK